MIPKTSTNWNIPVCVCLNHICALFLSCHSNNFSRACSVIIYGCPWIHARYFWFLSLWQNTFMMVICEYLGVDDGCYKDWSLDFLVARKVCKFQMLQMCLVDSTLMVIRYNSMELTILFFFLRFWKLKSSQGFLILWFLKVEAFMLMEKVGVFLFILWTRLDFFVVWEWGSFSEMVVVIYSWSSSHRQTPNHLPVRY